MHSLFLLPFFFQSPKPFPYFFPLLSSALFPVCTQDHDLLKALAALINDIEGPEKAVMYASSALRNLATDLWVSWKKKRADV